MNRALDTGVVVMGEIVISVAGVDLLYLNVNVLLSSVETLLDAMESSYAERGMIDAGGSIPDPMLDGNQGALLALPQAGVREPVAAESVRTTA